MGATATAQLPIIRPISDLHTKLNELCTQASEAQEPIVLTKNGVPAYVLMDSATYDEERRHARYYLALKEAEIEEQYRPQSLSAEESDARMKELFDLWGLTYA